MPKKRLLSIVGLVIICLFVLISGIGFYTQKEYFFNPLTFKKNSILYLPWSWYKKPLNIEMYTVGSENNKVVDVKNQNKVKFVFSELEKGSHLKAIPLNDLNNPSINLKKAPKELQSYSILIRTNGTEIVQSADIYPKEKLVEIWTEQGHSAFNEFVALTPSLQNYVEQQLNTK